MESEVVMIRTEFAETLVRMAGPIDAPPLVIHPGTWAHSLDWWSDLSELTESLSRSHRIYCIDDPWDFGQSVSTRPPGTVEDTMRWLDEVFDSLGLIQGVSVFGCSKGAWRFAEYALHAPQRLAKVVWLSPALVVQGASIKAAPSALQMIRVMLDPSPRAVAGMMHWLTPEYERVDNAGFDEYCNGIALSLQCFAKMPADARARVFRDDELRAISVPVLYMVGEHEKLSSIPAAVSRLKCVAPQIEIAVFPGVGHDLMLLQQAAVADRSLEFLSR